jgi:hypothetical protein
MATPASAAPIASLERIDATLTQGLYLAKSGQISASSAREA